jgi:hypothetical protein
MERIIYCLFSCAAMLTNVAHTSIGQTAGGAVVVVGDADLLSLQTGNPSIPLLYFSRDAYDEAVHGLSSQEIEAVINKRRAEWSPQALDHALDWLYRQEVKCLTLIALGRMGGTVRVVATGLDVHFQETIELLARLTSEGRYEDVDFTNLLVFALEKEALLIAELQAAGDTFSVEVQERTQTVQFLERALAGRGRPEYAQAPPYAELLRAIHIVPIDDALLARLKAEFEPFVPWREGLVARWRVREASELKRMNKTATLLYQNSGEFLEDLLELTPAQLTRIFEERARMVNRTQALNDYLNGLRLEALLLHETIRVRAAGEDSKLRKALNSSVDIQRVRLMTELASARSSLAQKAEPSWQMLSRLQKAEESIAADINFFGGLARQSGRQDIAQKLLPILAAKQRQITRLKSLTAVPE